MKRASVVSRMAAVAMALALAATPVAAISPGDPAKRAWASAIKAHIPKSKPRDGERGLHGRSQRRVNPQRQVRRRLEQLHQRLMGTRRLGRTWVRLHKALRRDTIRGSHSKAFLFLVVLEQHRNELEKAQRALTLYPKEKAA